MLQSAQELCCVEAASVLVELALPLKVVEQFAPVDCGYRSVDRTGAKATGLTETHDQVEFVWVLEGELQGHNEGIVDKREDSPFRQDMRDFARA